MTKARPLNETQQAEFDRFARSYGKYREAKATALARARAIAEAEVAALYVEAARDAHRALAQGVTKRRLGRDVMKTKDYVTIQKMLDSVSVSVQFDIAEAAARDADGRGEERPIRLEQVSDTLYRLTLSGDELEVARTRADWAPKKLIPAHAATAEVNRTGGHWVALTDAWLPEEAEQHPVVVWLSAESSQRKVEEVYTEVQK